MEQKRGEGKQRIWKEGQDGSRGGCLKKGGSWKPLRIMLFMHLIFCLNVLKETFFFKTGEQLNDLTIDWTCVKILTHLCKILFSEVWALWTKLDTSQIKYVCLQLPDHPC